MHPPYLILRRWHKFSIFVFAPSDIIEQKEIPTTLYWMQKSEAVEDRGFFINNYFKIMKSNIEASIKILELTKESSDLKIEIDKLTDQIIRLKDNKHWVDRTLLKLSHNKNYITLIKKEEENNLKLTCEINDRFNICTSLMPYNYDSK